MGARCAPRRADPLCERAARGGRREHGGGGRQADRASGRVLPDPRSGSRARLDRSAHGPAGLDADGVPDRSGAAARARARGLPGDRLPRDVRAAHQVGRGGDRARADPRARQPGVRGSDLRAAGPGRPLLPRGRARIVGGGARRAALQAGRGGARPRGAGPRPRAGRTGEPAARHRGRRRLERRSGACGAVVRRGIGSPGRVRVALPRLHRQPLTILCRPPRAAEGSRPVAASARRRPCCWSSAIASAT